MSAEYGRAAGATINVAYRSGTNRFTVSGWEFFRDSSLTSEGYFTPAAGQEPKFDRNQFGGTIGGPIMKNRAFFFGDIEALRQNRTTVATSTLPTMAQRQGVLTVAVRHPQTGVVYPAGTTIPLTAFASKVLRDLPEPTTTGTANNFVRLVTSETVSDKAGGKVDMVFNPRWTGFGRFGWRDALILDEPGISGPSGGEGNGSTYAQNLQLALGTTYAPD